MFEKALVTDMFAALSQMLQIQEEILATSQLKPVVLMLGDPEHSGNRLIR